MGHQAVMVFFVLSGFFVGGGALKKIKQFNAMKYVVARLSRLWIVLVPALVATAGIDLAIETYSPDVLNGQYSALWNSGPTERSSYSASIQTFFANIFFLQTVAAPVFGTNGPLWSLSNEFWYYVLFLIFILAIFGRTNEQRLSNLTRLFLSLIGLSLMQLLPVSMMIGFLIWTMGLIVYATQGRTCEKLNSALLIIGCPLFLAALGYSKSETMQRLFGISSDLLVGSTFCIVAIGIVNRANSISHPNWFHKLAGLISDFSFSLYLIHFPVVALIGGLFFRNAKLQANWNGLLHFVFWLFLLLVCGWIFYFLFERRTDIFRKRIETIVNGATKRI
jgi:peptidoglycan/LPS O-acetylase OafA/YrhL